MLHSVGHNAAVIRRPNPNPISHIPYPSCFTLSLHCSLDTRALALINRGLVLPLSLAVPSLPLSHSSRSSCLITISPYPRSALPPQMDHHRSRIVVNRFVLCYNEHQRRYYAVYCNCKPQILIIPTLLHLFCPPATLCAIPIFAPPAAVERISHTFPLLSCVHQAVLRTPLSRNTGRSRYPSDTRSH